MSTSDTPATFSEAVEAIRGAWLRLAASTGVAVDTLIDVMANGRNDLARVNAATALLDRVGVPARAEVNVRLAAPVETDPSEDPQQLAIVTLRERLALISSGSGQSSAGKVIDADVVDDIAPPVTHSDEDEAMIEALGELFGDGPAA